MLTLGHAGVSFIYSFFRVMAGFRRHMPLCGQSHKPIHLSLFVFFFACTRSEYKKVIVSTLWFFNYLMVLFIRPDPVKPEDKHAKVQGTKRICSPCDNCSTPSLDSFFFSLLVILLFSHFSRWHSLCSPSAHNPLLFSFRTTPLRLYLSVLCPSLSFSRHSLIPRHPVNCLQSSLCLLANAI